MSLHIIKLCQAKVKGVFDPNHWILNFKYIFMSNTHPQHSLWDHLHLVSAGDVFEVTTLIMSQSWNNPKPHDMTVFFLRAAVSLMRSRPQMFPVIVVLLTVKGMGMHIDLAI